MRQRSPSWFGWASCVLFVAACGAPPPPATPAPAAPTPPAASASAATETPSAPEAPAPEPVASTPPPAEPPPEKKAEPEPEEKPSRPPLEIITAADTAFLVNYPSSAANEAARKTCSEKGGSDDEAIAKCMSDARAAFKADVLRFKKDGSHWSLIVYKRDGSRLDETYSARVDLSEESPSSVKLKFTGSEKGLRPLLKGKREASLGVPNDYSVIITDADLGKLVFEAKIGLVAN